MGLCGNSSVGDEDNEESSGGSGFANVGPPDVKKCCLNSGDRPRIPVIRICGLKDGGRKKDGNEIVVEKVALVGIGSSRDRLEVDSMGCFPGRESFTRESELGRSFEGSGVAERRGLVSGLSGLRWGEKKKRELLPSQDCQSRRGNQNKDHRANEVCDAEEDINEENKVSKYNSPGFVCSNSQKSALKGNSCQKIRIESVDRPCTNKTMPGQNYFGERKYEVLGTSRSSKLANNDPQYLENNAGVTANQNMNQEIPNERKIRMSQEQNINKVGGCQASSTTFRLKIKYRKDNGQNSLKTVASGVASASSTDSAGLVSDHRNFPSQNRTPAVLGGNEENFGDDETSMQLQVQDMNSSKIESYPNTSSSDLYPKSKDEAHNLGDPTDVVREEEWSTQNKRVDPGSCHDLEVINSIQDAQINVRCLEDSRDAVSNLSKGFPLTEELIGSRSGEKTDNQSCASRSYKIDSLLGHSSFEKRKTSKKCVIKIKCGSIISSTHVSASDILPSSHYELSGKPLPPLGDIGCLSEALDVGMENETEFRLDADSGLSLSQDSKVLLHSQRKKRKLLKRIKSGKGSKNKSKASGAGTPTKGTDHRQKESQKKTISRTEVEDSVASKEEEVSCDIGYQHKKDNEEKTIHNVNKTPVDVSDMNVVPYSDMKPYLCASKAWVSCDYCHKWRQISPSLLESIRDRRWVCKDNTDIAYSDCSIPQEKSNVEINEELGVSDSSDDEDPCNDLREIRRKLRTNPFNGYIKTNIFLHRSRKAPTIDEVMVCQCKAPLDGRLGCGRECLNRVVNVECVKGMCPLGDLCSNQQFQRRKWANLQLFYSGKKGYGLQSCDDISSGQFLIEYVGEVLDMHTYTERQKEYAEKGHRHFYFMTLDGNEVIDAYAKGNAGRYINHSCDPNCTTEKWMVNGEICIGIFAMKDIKKGEELTCDYKYQRVSGAAAQQCYCGSSKCRGYLGGEPLSSEMVVQGDSIEKYPEPVMLHRDDKIVVSLNNKKNKNDSCYGEESQNAEFEVNEKLNSSSAAVRQSKTTIETEVTMKISASAVGEFQNSLDVNDLTDYSTNPQPSEKLLQRESPMGKRVSAAKQESSTEEETMKKVFGPTEDSQISPYSSDFKANKLLKFDSSKKKLGSRPCTKDSRTSSSAKRRKICSTMKGGKDPSTCNKSLPLPVKSKKSAESLIPGHSETVEKKLNELLNTNGGISKRQDASQGYLKLLLLTASSAGSCSGEAIQSTRDLSLILDAMLKTKSRVVLTDIINKNGLRMLHNIMKQYRGDFKKIPVLRKLLKVLEYLAKNEILTAEHINESPPCPGMESFRDSMLSLTEHEDKEVHQIARHFRDRWIPRRRKSRWDQPTVCNPLQGEVNKNLHEDVPPPFSSCIGQVLSHPLRTNAYRPGFPAVVATGHLKAKFDSHLPVSYGIPLAIVEQFGSPGTGGEDWLIAPGIAFNPFPPLPQYPRDKKDQAPPCAAKHLITGQTGGQCNSHGPTASDRGSQMPTGATRGKEGSNPATTDGNIQLPTSATGGQWSSYGIASSDGNTKFPRDKKVQLPPCAAKHLTTVQTGGLCSSHGPTASDGGSQLTAGATRGKEGSNGPAASDGNIQLPTSATGGQWGSYGIVSSDGNTKYPIAASDGSVKFFNGATGGQCGNHGLACSNGGGIGLPTGATGGQWGSQALARSDGGGRLPIGGTGGQGIQGLPLSDGGSRLPACGTGGQWGNHSLAWSAGGTRPPAGGTGAQGSQGLARFDGVTNLPAGGIGGYWVNQGFACFDGGNRLPVGGTVGQWGNHGFAVSHGGIGLPAGGTGQWSNRGLDPSGGCIGLPSGATGGQWSCQRITSSDGSILCPNGATGGQWGNHASSDANVQLPTGANRPGTEGPINQHDHKRAGDFSGDHEMRHRKQVKGNSTNVGPPWL